VEPPAGRVGRRRPQKKVALVVCPLKANAGPY